MKTTISIIIGVLIVVMAIPMFIIPIVSIGVIIWGFYAMFHETIGVNIHNHRHAG